MNSSYLLFKEYRRLAQNSKSSGPFVMGLWRDQDCIYVHRDLIDPQLDQTALYLKVLVKSLLWIHGANRISVQSDLYCYDIVQSFFKDQGELSFERSFFSDLFDSSFEVFSSIQTEIGLAKSTPLLLNSSGVRVGLDLGGSSIKACLLREGKVQATRILEWSPLDTSTIKNGLYIVDKIVEIIEGLVADTNEIDAIGISTSGVVMNGELYLSALYRYFHNPKECRDLVANLQTFYPCPINLINDGEAAALEVRTQEGAMAIVMGSDEGGGYLAPKAKSLDQIDELAFVPIDLDPMAPIDSWSKHRGCGGVYLSVRGLDHFKKLGKNSEECAQEMGKILAHALGFYSYFYSFNKVILLGGVTSDGRREIMEASCIEEWNRLNTQELPSSFVIPSDQFRFQQAVTAAKLSRENL